MINDETGIFGDFQGFLGVILEMFDLVCGLKVKAFNLLTSFPGA